MTHLLLIRHGESLWNAEKRIQGQGDSPLSERGVEQVRRLAVRLKLLDRGQEVAAVYASPLGRARQTAHIVARELGLAVVFDERLAEYNVGALTGLRAEDVAERYPHIWQGWQEGRRMPYPGEEGGEAFHRRVAAAMDDIVRRHSDETVAVICHGGTLRAYLVAMLGLNGERWYTFAFDNASLTIVKLGKNGACVLLLNDTCHLEG